MRLRIVVAVLWTILILVLCWTPQEFLLVSEKPNSITQVLHLDKFVHGAIFAIFAILWLRVGGSRPRYLWVLVAGAALAGLTEVVQNIPFINREGEFQDALADFAGVLCGFPIFQLIGQRLRDRTSEPAP
jgi:hypothetical protein